MMDKWPDNSPELLEDLCVRCCIENLQSFTTSVSGPYGKVYFLLPSVSLPKTICDKIFSFYYNSFHEDRIIDDGFLSIFRDPLLTQLSCVNLANTEVTDEGLKLICDQPIVELDLSQCYKLTRDCLPSIFQMGKTLRTLKLESSRTIFDGPPVSLSKYKEEGHTLSTESHVFESFSHSFPNLCKLSLRQPVDEDEFPLEDESGDGICALEVTLKSFVSLTHLDLTGCTVLSQSLHHFQYLSNLIWLCLADVLLDDVVPVIPSIHKLRKLKHLDLSQGNADSVPVMYVQPEETLRSLVEGLPFLTSLDLSGTNLSGFEKTAAQSFRLEKCDMADVEESPKCSIPGLEGRHFDFLGLLGCAYGACHRKNIPGLKVTGDHDEDQVLLSLQVYQDRCNLFTKALNNLFPMFRISTVQRQCAALEAILAGMKKHPYDKHVQISGSASLFYIAKGEKKDNITQKQKRKIVDLLLRAMEEFPTEQTMMRNGCLTLCHFNIPYDVLYCYEKLANILLRMLERQHPDEFIHRIGIFLLNCLACQVDGKEKETVGKLGAIETMLSIIESKVFRSQCDEVMEVAWSTMWNITDETPPNCERFMDKRGMRLFILCLEKYPHKAELLRNMMGLMGNIAEVKELRCRLMVEEYLEVFSDLLDSTSDGIEVSYNAAGVLAHMASDGPNAWLVESPCRRHVLRRMFEAINRWDIGSRRNINYRSFQPILRLLTIFDTPEVQHWAVWALCNLTGFCPEKYCSLLEKENGIQLLEELLANDRPYRSTHRLAKRVLKNIRKPESVNGDQLSDSETEEAAGAEGGKDQMMVEEACRDSACGGHNRMDSDDDIEHFLHPQDDLEEDDRTGACLNVRCRLHGQGASENDSQGHGSGAYCDEHGHSRNFKEGSHHRLFSYRTGRGGAEEGERCPHSDSGSDVD